MTVLQNPRVKSKGNGAAAISGRPRPTRPALDGPLSDLRFAGLVRHLHRLGPKPVSELLKELIGPDAGLQADTLFLLEKYGALDPEIVRTLGGDDFAPLPIHAVADR